MSADVKLKIIMGKLRKVKYYTSDNYNPQAGFKDGVDEDNYKTTIGLFHRFADYYLYDNDQYHPLTVAIVEDEDTGEIKQIDIRRLTRFVKE